jgi:hypothetical protein
MPCLANDDFDHDRDLANSTLNVSAASALLINHSTPVWQRRGGPGPPKAGHSTLSAFSDGHFNHTPTPTSLVTTRWSTGFYGVANTQGKSPGRIYGRP